MLGKVLFKINQNFGRIFFNNPNNLYNNIFNLSHKILISKKTTNTHVQKFLSHGFFKPEINSNDFCEKINAELNLQKTEDENGYFHFEITDKIKDLIKEHINNNFKNLLNEFEHYFNANISVAKVIIKRNFNIDKFENEVYSNNYHVDHNTYNHFKLFINLMDTDERNGPLHIYSKESTKNFVKINNYRNRNNYKKNDLNDQLYINSGKKGDSLIADTSMCLHKAGRVEKGQYRDILFITFITIPKKVVTKDFFYFDEIFPGIIWMPVGGSKLIKIAKPSSFRKMVSTFFDYYKNKIN